MRNIYVVSYKQILTQIKKKREINKRIQKGTKNI